MTPAGTREAVSALVGRRVFGALFLALALAACDENTIPPEQAARAFLDATKTPFEGAPVCTGGDTDHDGYVTCTVRQPRADNPQGPFLSLQCAALGAALAKGCKLSPSWKSGAQ